ncbi:hypothetical protein JAAARDRAFT_55974 [Jaapia argillacea MUCL 33604]|uniref:protein-tyrosine-phosphatase n=1 Tax=Jaapia argillacea MUCL 33604 TaxID=933084 RepID=A0A067Q571_9AGAM|nr:hypothetical protein JAAARDRAFT_55974 [Jaapia argillacea MUCL 33604]
MSASLRSPNCFSPSYASSPSISNARPDISEILPRLYISDLTVAEDPKILSHLGITHVLSAMRGYVAIPSSSSHPSFSLPLTHAQIPLEDSPFSELAAHLPTSTQFLRDALRDPNSKVLVHCLQGVSRSASVVAAYLMATYGWTPAQAVGYIKSKRSVAEPNFGFISQLQEYADSLGGSRGTRKR